jgi:hypothetical protein
VPQATEPEWLRLSAVLDEVDAVLCRIGRSEGLVARPEAASAQSGRVEPDRQGVSPAPDIDLALAAAVTGARPSEGRRL